MHVLLNNSAYQFDILQIVNTVLSWELLDGKRLLITGATGMILWSLTL